MFARRQALGTLSKIGYLAAGLALGAVLLGTSTVNGAADTTPTPLGTQLPWPTLPVKEVRPGMTGYGLTVFAGTKPERFPVRVVGVLPKHSSLMDIILVESDDPRLRHAGGGVCPIIRPRVERRTRFFPFSQPRQAFTPEAIQRRIVGPTSQQFVKYLRLIHQL